MARHQDSRGGNGRWRPAPAAEPERERRLDRCLDLAGHPIQADRGSSSARCRSRCSNLQLAEDIGCLRMTVDRANKHIIAADHVSLSGVVAGQVADDQISIDCEHDAALLRQRCLLPSPRAFWRPRMAERSKTVLGRVGAKSGAALSNAPSGVSSTRSCVPASQRRSCRMALGRMIWPLVDTVVVEFLQPRDGALIVR